MPEESAILLKEVNQVRDTADLIFNQQEIERAIAKMAEQLQTLLGDTVPLFLCVMNGGLMLTSDLLKRYSGNAHVDYLHVTRYREQTAGGSLHWRKEPEYSLNGRTVVLVDDILDEGYTLEELISYCHNKGADRVLTAILLDKQRPDRSLDLKPDVCGLLVENRYVFGYGMDYKGYLRNLPEIYAVKGL